MNARLKGDEIISKVDGTYVIIVHGDISVLFDFPVKEGALPNCSGHAFNQEDLWKEVNGGQASVELKLTLKKMVLQPENERAIDILSRIVENRVVGTYDITAEKFSMVSAILNNYNVDWLMVIFNFLRQFIEKVVDKKTKNLT